MNMQKFIAIVLSILINCGVLALFHAWSTTAVASIASPAQRAQAVVTLPVITVRPTRAQMELLRRETAPLKSAGSIAPTGSAAVQYLAMPYYSFETTSGAVDKG